MSNAVRASFLARPSISSLLCGVGACLAVNACVDGSAAPDSSPITGAITGGARSTTGGAKSTNPGFGGVSTGSGGYTSASGGTTSFGQGGVGSGGVNPGTGGVNPGNGGANPGSTGGANPGSTGGVFSGNGGGPPGSNTGGNGASSNSGGARSSGGFPSTGGTLNSGGSFGTGGARPSGGTPSTGGTTMGNTGGTPNTGGAPMTNTGGTPSTPGPGFGNPQQSGSGQTSERYYKTDVSRSGVNYFFMANGWGPGFQSQSVSWNGTSFTVSSMQGKQGGNYEPASYPTVFCGVYSDSASKQCGLPKAKSEIKSLRTGWKWQANGNSGQYNAAWDIWLGNGTSISSHASFVMVWLRDPPGQQPAGMKRFSGVQVANSGSWDLWVGVVGGKPCLSYVKPEGQDMAQFEFDAMDFIRDLEMRGVQAPGSHVLSVAVGFEIWNGPINNLVSQDFYVAVQ